MIKAKHHIVIYPLFKLLTRYLLKRNFNSINIEGVFNDNVKPVLVIANHISWWDGFWISYLNLKVTHRKIHFMMLEEQLKKHWYFQFSGAYSIKKNSRSVLDSIDYTYELLKVKENMVFVFPQGKINSMQNNFITFEKGVKRIVETCITNVQVLFVANFIDYFSNAKPNLFMYIKSISAFNFTDNSIEHEYNNFYMKALNEQKTKVS